jgi:hypothetical protein
VEQEGLFVELGSSLDTLRRRHHAAMDRRDNNAAFEACEDVLKWGGVSARNRSYLEMRKDTLVDELQHTSHVLSADRTPTKDDMRHPAAPASDCRLNAGFVKILQRAARLLRHL